MPIHKISISFDRLRKVYRQGEHISGTIIIDNKYNLKHDGIFVIMDGFVEINANLKSVNLMDTFTNSNKIIKLVDFTYELVKPGSLRPGHNKIPFNVLIDASVDTASLYETYHGVFISIQYLLKCRVKRSFFQRDLMESSEFYIEYCPTLCGPDGMLETAESGLVAKRPVKFKITPDSLSAAPTVAMARREQMPDFQLEGQLDSLIWSLNEPITGEFVIKRCDVVIRSVELQLVRVETCGKVETESHNTNGQNFNVSSATNDLGQIEQAKGSRDATEVQNIQIGDGDLLRNLPISIHMVLPRLFTCPTLKTNQFSIEFEINLVIIFSDNYLITENFPIQLVRAKI